MEFGIQVQQKQTRLCGSAKLFQDWAVLRAAWPCVRETCCELEGFLSLVKACEASAELPIYPSALSHLNSPNLLTEVQIVQSEIPGNLDFLWDLYDSKAQKRRHPKTCRIELSIF